MQEIGRTKVPGRACILCLLDFPSDFGAAVTTPSGIAFLVLWAVGIVLLVLAIRTEAPTKSPTSTRELTDEMLDAMLDAMLEEIIGPPSGVRGPRQRRLCRVTPLVPKIFYPTGRCRREGCHGVRFVGSV